MKTIKLLLATAAMGLLTFTTSAQSWVTNGLVAYYPFSGNANDASGNGNNGTVYGATLSSDRFGNANSAYSFTSSLDNAIEITATNLVSGTNNKSFCCWFKAYIPFTQSGDLWSAGSYANNNPNGWIEGRMFYVNSQTAALQLGMLNTDWHTYFTNITDNNWHQYVVTINTNSVVFGYLDGNPIIWQTAAPPGTTISVFPAPFYIGYGSGEYFNGMIDDVRIYNRLLSSTEVAQLYAIESVGPTVGLAYAVKPTFSHLTIGTNYQLQVSTSLAGTFTNSGSPFTATNSSMMYPQYFDVANWSQLFFRLQQQ